MAVAVAAIVAIAVLVFVFVRLGSARTQLETDTEKQKRMSRRERKLEKVREFDPLPEPKSIYEVMMDEAEELGVDSIAGGEGLEVPVKLKVVRRDAGVRETCLGSVRYEVKEGVDPAAASERDVRLVCDETAEGASDQADIAPEQAGADDSGRDTDSHESQLATGESGQSTPEGTEPSDG